MRRFICAALVLLCATSFSFAQTPTAARVIARTVTLETYAPVLELSGTVEAARTINVSFRAGGRVIERFVDIGDRVQQGQVLATLDTTQYVAAVRASEAARDAAQARRDQAETTYARLEALLNSGTMTRSAVEDAQAERRSAQAALDAAEADLARARDTQDDTSLLAPASGIVAARMLEVGEIVQPGQPVYLVAEDGPRNARFNIYEAALIGVNQEVPIELEVLGASGRYSGRVREIAPTLNPLTGTIAVKLAIEGESENLPLGATVVGHAQARAVQAVILPASALTIAGTAPAVWVISPSDSRLELRPVEVEAFKNEHVIIKGGLSEGERVAIVGPRAMRPGLLVESVAERGE